MEELHALMEDLQALMEEAFIKWNEENFVLLRIRFIVRFLTLSYIIMYLFSGLTYFSMRKSLLSLLDAVTEAVLAYTLGAMQAALFKKPIFPVWALALVSFRSSISCLQKYGTFSELRNVLKLTAVAFLNVKHGSKLIRIPFWLFWSLSLLKCLYRVVALRQASKSLWQARCSDVLQNYMGHEQNNFNPESCDPQTMVGYRYLVYYGSAKQIEGTEHTLSVNDLRSAVTLDEIWEHFRGNYGFNLRMKNLSLAFALSLLLRCRLEGAKLHAATVSMTQKLICSLISTNNDEYRKNAVFTILENDLLFLHQYLHTGYPAIFWQGLLSLFYTVILCITKYCIATWMGIVMKNLYTPDAVGVVRNQISAEDGDFYMTAMAIAIMLFMEGWEGITYVMSKWTALLLICKYTSCSSGVMRHYIGSLLGNIYKCSIFSAEVKDTGRYDFLQSFTKLKKQRGRGCLPSIKSFDYSVWKWNLVVVAYKVVGIKLRDSLEGIKGVKAAVIQALTRSMDLEGNHLQRELPWQSVSGRKERYWSACLQLPPRCSHVILVWHIATSLCELKLAQDRGVDLRSKPELFSFLQCKKSLAGDLKKMHTVANCLSQYCAYLLVSKPELLPNPILVTKKVLLDTAQRAQEKLGQCDSLQDMYDTIIPPGATVSGSHDIKLSGDILEQGAMLAKELIHEDEEQRWEILTEVWADLLVHIAPSPNVEAHAKNLELGNEIITVIWALLCHCGIEKSKLWPDDSGAEETIQGHLNRKNCAGACVQKMPTPAPPAAPRDTHGGDIKEVEDIAAGARAQQVATPAPPAATRDTNGGDIIEEVEDIERITETGPTSSPTT